MGVPESIRAVERPKGTVVVDNGRDGPYRWAVRKLDSVRTVEGKKNPQPHWGKVIGHIIEGHFVELVAPMHTLDENGNRVIKPDNVMYGFPALIGGLVQDIKEDLLKIFPARSAYEILTIATLRVAHPGVSDCMLNYHYRKSYVSQQYPGMPLSGKTVHNLFEEIGASKEKRGAFSLLRLQRVSSDHHIAIDGMLVQDNGDDNDLGSYTGKARVKGQKEISILYAYDVELKEPVCGEVFPGNYVDSNAYLPFLRDNHITKGIVVDDKGFLPDKIADYLAQNPDLHFLTPIKRDDKRISNYEMLDWTKPTGEFNKILYTRKAKTEDGHYLYAFKDIKRAEAEDALFAIHAIEKGNFDKKKHKEKEPLFGVIVFESDLDMEPETAYKIYDERWYIEMLFREYKSTLEMDETREKQDFTVIGSHFVNMISSIINSRVLNKIAETDLFKKNTYAAIRTSLEESWRQVDAPAPVTDDEYWDHTNIEDFVILEKLGLSTPDPRKPLKSKGKRSNGKKAEQTESTKGQKQDGSAPGEVSAPKASVDNEKKEKRGRGRPRIHPPKDPNAPKGKPGRPRIHPPKDPNVPKGKPGRPRIHPPKDPNAPKGKPGRPRIHPPKDPNAPKGKPGRPPKVQPAAS